MIVLCGVLGTPFRNVGGFSFDNDKINDIMIMPPMPLRTIPLRMGASPVLNCPS